MLLSILVGFYAVAARNEGARWFVKVYFDECRKSVAAVVREGMEQGEFRGVDAEWIAMTLIYLSEGVTLLRAFDPDTVPIGGQLEASVRLLTEGTLNKRS